MLLDFFPRNEQKFTLFAKFHLRIAIKIMLDFCRNFKSLAFPRGWRPLLPVETAKCGPKWSERGFFLDGCLDNPNVKDPSCGMKVCANCANINGYPSALQGRRSGTFWS